MGNKDEKENKNFTNLLNIFYIDLARKIPPFRVDYELPASSMNLFDFC